jgi:dihydrofolate reductase
MSLDARIADGDGRLDWLTPYGAGAGVEQDYEDFVAGIDAVVLGRATFDFVVAAGAWPYATRASYVVTRRPLDPPHPSVQSAPPDFGALKARIERAGHRRVWIVGGGQVQRAALDAGMLDDLRLFVIPLLVGSGPLVFASGVPRAAQLVGHKRWPNGIAELTYRFPSTAPVMP